MLKKIALMVELSDAARELDLMGKFAESHKLLSTMEVLAAEVAKERKASTKLTK